VHGCFCHHLYSFSKPQVPFWRHQQPPVEVIILLHIYAFSLNNTSFLSRNIFSMAVIQKVNISRSSCRRSSKKMNICEGLLFCVRCRLMD
jgi:hypothetical protein